MYCKIIKEPTIEYPYLAVYSESKKLDFEYGIRDILIVSLVPLDSKGHEKRVCFQPLVGGEELTVIHSEEFYVPLPKNVKVILSN
jgi:hypothetical protein